MLKKLLLDIRKTVYILFAICLFSIIGSIIIHTYPEGYFKIHIYQLFKWLFEHKRLDTFWIYIIIILFFYTGLSSFLCLTNDIKRKSFLVALMHLSVILFLIAHFISAIYTFRINDQFLVENMPSKIFVYKHKREINLNVKKISYEMTQFGIPINIKGIIELPDGTEKEISINNPIKIDDYHLVLKDVTGFLSQIELQLEKKGEIYNLTFKPNVPTKFNNIYLTILDISEDFSTLKLKVEDEKNTYTTFIKIGQYLSIHKEKISIRNIIPIFHTAIVIDVIYDPSLMIIFISSSLFTIALIVQLITKRKKIFKNE